MRKCLCLLLTLLLAGSLTVPASAANITDGNDVVAKFIATYAEESRAEVVDGSATAGGITVTDAPENAVTLVVIPMEGDALAWADSCVDGNAVSAYYIYFLDAQGNRINADGASVSIPVSGSDRIVSSLTTSGADRKLTSEVSGGKIAFTTDGSHYYVIAEKAAEVTPGDRPCAG